MFGMRKRYALMEGAGDGGAPSGGGDGGTAAPASAPTATPATLAPAATPAAPAPSALAVGGAQPAPVAPGSSPDFIPEKFRVTKADGALDIEASARKLAEAHGSLETRLGTVGAPPKDATEYQVTVPDALKEAVGDLNTDKTFTEFRDQMHGLGLTQKQFDGVMARYFELAPALAAGGHQVSAEQATASLRETWKDDGEFKKNVGLSYQAASKIAAAAGLSYEDVEKAGLGNNATFIKLMAAIGPEFSEDTPVNGGTKSFMSDDAVKQLMASEANLNPKHPQHKATRAQIDSYYARKYGNTPVA